MTGRSSRTVGIRPGVSNLARTLMAMSLPHLWFAVPVGGRSCGTRFGNREVRPLGGGLGCLFMVLFSAVASVVLTVLVNLLLWQHL